MSLIFVYVFVKFPDTSWTRRWISDDSNDLKRPALRLYTQKMRDFLFLLVWKFLAIQRVAERTSYLLLENKGNTRAFF